MSRGHRGYSVVEFVLFLAAAALLLYLVIAALVKLWESLEKGILRRRL